MIDGWVHCLAIELLSIRCFRAKELASDSHLVPVYVSEAWASPAPAVAWHMLGGGQVLHRSERFVSPPPEQGRLAAKPGLL